MLMAFINEFNEITKKHNMMQQFMLNDAALIDLDTLFAKYPKYNYIGDFLPNSPVRWRHGKRMKHFWNRWF